MAGRFSGKTAVITGSGRRKGLGEAIALRLAQEGANIVLSDIGKARDAATSAEHVGEMDEMAAIAADISAMGVGVTMKACDVRIPSEVEALADHAVATFGSLDKLGAWYLLMLLSFVLVTSVHRPRSLDSP